MAILFYLCNTTIFGSRSQSQLDYFYFISERFYGRANMLHIKNVLEPCQYHLCPTVDLPK